ncbi:26S proteasome regulatory subunit 7 [Rhodotorula kratochvilovae]
MDYLRTSADPLGPHGLARLPEELVDLVCSFVRDFHVEDAVTTLSSLCLTSRQFLDPAHRALLYDPSRVLARREVEHAHLFLNRILGRPELGMYVKELEGLVDLFDNVPALSRDHELPVAFVNWAMSLLRCCPNLEAVAVWPDAAVGWSEELERLPRLRHLTVQARFENEQYLEDDLGTAHSFLTSARLDHLSSLTLRQLGHLGYDAPVQLPVSWSEYFAEMPALPNLTVVVMHAIDVDLVAFERVITVARNLQHIELRNSVWAEYDWAIGLPTSPDDRLVDALHRLPRLRFLHLGAIPGVHGLTELPLEPHGAFAEIDDDAISGARFDDGAGGDNEVQRTMLELINQLDGFDPRGNIKVLMATNRPDTLDPALLRPGRIDRKVEFGLPDQEGRAHILRIHARSMSVEKNVRFDLIARLCPNATGAELRAVATEAGMFAIRQRRKIATEKDFLDAVEKVIRAGAKFSSTGLYAQYQ